MLPKRKPQTNFDAPSVSATEAVVHTFSQAPAASAEALLCSAAAFGGNCQRFGTHDLLRIRVSNPG